jgi:DNA repair protein RadD
MPPQTLRPYQEDGIARVFAAWRGGARSVLTVSPTGSGKTTLFGTIASELDTGGRRVLILVHRRELATQACNRLREFGVRFGLIMAGEQPTPYARVQVASVQTLARRKAPPADLVICDEAHLSTAKTWHTILEQYPRARILGVTATPWRLSGKPLAGAYDACVVVSTPRELREQGYLCDYVGFSYLTPDLSDVATTAGDYNERESAEAMSAGVIVDTIVEEWGKHARELSTVVFAVTVEHSKQLTARFRAAGVAAEHLDGTTSLEQRRAILARVESGLTRVLCNVGVAVEGLDIPRLKCCILARPTMSLARAIQMMGRVRRPWQGVTARIHDHAFVIGKHGLPDADRDYTLNAKPEKPPSLTTCPECMAVYTGRQCTNCGAADPKPPVEHVVQTITEAEQYGFRSGEDQTAVAPPRPDKPPVKVTWTKPGRSYTGVYTERRVEAKGYGDQAQYLLRGEKRDYLLPGATRLDLQMAIVPLESLIRVTYTGDTKLPKGFRREFTVEVDDGQPEVEVRPTGKPPAWLKKIGA